MIIIPAIDLKEGNCVRLLQGDFARMTVFSSDPVEIASRWMDEGASRLHVVDLDGSRSGRPVNGAVIERIVGRTGLPVQVGGGIRTLETVRSYLESGVRWVILGTAALKDPEFVFEACRLYPRRIMLGIDAGEGRLMVEAWTEDSGRLALDVARQYETSGIDAIVYTDTKRDGMEAGVNVESTKQLAESVKIPVIASGGVSGIGDIERLKKAAPSGICGVIIGKALYTGALSLRDALRAAGP